MIVPAPFWAWRKYMQVPPSFSGATMHGTRASGLFTPMDLHVFVGVARRSHGGASELSAARVRALSGLAIGTTSRVFSSSRFSGSLTTLPLGPRWRARPLPVFEISSNPISWRDGARFMALGLGYMLPVPCHRTPHGPLVGLLVHMWSALTVCL